MDKTNALRILDSKKIEYEAFAYDSNETNGENIAKLLKEDPDQVFKTLVTESNTHEYFVFVVPVNATLNLKKAAKAASVKSIEMIKQKELLPLTGYIHGGCSPIGMKKVFKTFLNDTSILFDKIFVSGGRCGLQVKIKPSDIASLIPLEVIDLID